MTTISNPKFHYDWQKANESIDLSHRFNENLDDHYQIGVNGQIVAVVFYNLHSHNKSWVWRVFVPVDGANRKQTIEGKSPDLETAKKEANQLMISHNFKLIDRKFSILT